MPTVAGYFDLIQLPSVISVPGACDGVCRLACEAFGGKRILVLRYALSNHRSAFGRIW